MVKTSNIVNIDYNTNLEICFLCNFIDNLKLEMAYVPCAEIWSAKSLKCQNQFWASSIHM